MSAVTSRQRRARLPLAHGQSLDVDTVLVMGILNATPDSFSDGGEIDDPVERARRIDMMLAAGVDIIDIGGESSRPGHLPVDAAEEMRRVLPVIEAVRDRDTGIPISIDTRKAVVAQAALDHGASFVNDVSAFDDPAMADVVTAANCAYVGMRCHDLEAPVVDSCRRQLADILTRAATAGIPETSIILDPGLGFGAHPGPSTDDNLALIDGIGDYSLGRPVLIGASRKRFVRALGESHGRDVGAQSVWAALRAARAGASIVRVHDVMETITGLEQAGLRS